MPAATLTAAKFAKPAASTDLVIKTQQNAVRYSGNYVVVGTTLQVVGDELCEAVNLRAGRKVLDVAAGNGIVSLGAARCWCDVVSTDYVASLLGRGRARASAPQRAALSPGVS